MIQLMGNLIYPCEKIRAIMYDYAEKSLPIPISMRFRIHISTCTCCKEYLRLYQAAANPKTFRRDKEPPLLMMDKTLEFLEQEGIL